MSKHIGTTLLPFLFKLSCSLEWEVLLVSRKGGGRFYRETIIPIADFCSVNIVSETTGLSKEIVTPIGVFSQPHDNVTRFKPFAIDLHC